MDDCTFADAIAEKRSLDAAISWRMAKPKAVGVGSKSLAEPPVALTALRPPARRFRSTLPMAEKKVGVKIPEVGISSIT